VEEIYIEKISSLQKKFIGPESDGKGLCGAVGKTKKS
jgi:hypothetical protein